MLGWSPTSDLHSSLTVTNFRLAHSRTEADSGDGVDMGLHCGPRPPIPADTLDTARVCNWVAVHLNARCTTFS